MTQSLDDKLLKNTIFVVDDDEEVLRSVIDYFQLLGFQTQGFSSAKDYLDTLDGTPGCLVSDVSMPEMNGIELLTRLNKMEHLRPALLMTGEATVDLAVQAIKLGALNFVEKPFTSEFLLSKVIGVIAEFEYSLISINRYKTLTEKEQQVFSLMVKGVINRNIADQLCMSVSTLEKHRSKVMKKMQADSLAELVQELPKLKPLGLHF